MSYPYYVNVGSTTSGAPGTGSFTPNAAAAGYTHWTSVHSGWIGLVFYRDGSTWELRYGYWNGTTITRPANGFVTSSSGSGLSLSASATAHIAPADAEFGPNWVEGKMHAWYIVHNATTINSIGIAAPTANGSATAVALTNTSLMTTQRRLRYVTTSGTYRLAGPTLAATASVHHCVRHTGNGQGGWYFSTRFGVSTLAASNRVQVGVSAAVLANSIQDPAAILNYACFTKDTGETNFQFSTNDGSGVGGKNDTGLAPVGGAWYEMRIYCPPGGAFINGLLIRLDNGDIWYGSRNSDLPTAATGMSPVILVSTGTASATTTLDFGGMCLQSF